jgi:hypothetical protein
VFQQRYGQRPSLQQRRYVQRPGFHGRVFSAEAVTATTVAIAAIGITAVVTAPITATGSRQLLSERLWAAPSPARLEPATSTLPGARTAGVPTACPTIPISL